MIAGFLDSTEVQCCYELWVILLDDRVWSNYYLFWMYECKIGKPLYILVIVINKGWSEREIE